MALQVGGLNGGSAAEAVWGRVVEEAAAMLREADDFTRGLLGPELEASVLRWNNLEDAVAAHVAGKLAGASASPAERWRRLLSSVLRQGTSDSGEPLREVMAADLAVVKERDAACPGAAHALLFYKGFQGLQLHRVANVVWRRGQRPLASLLQSLTSQLFAMDIHPAARIGRGLFIDHATGVVIGETAVVGPGCTLLHGVTLGGTGKESGDRHPKLGSQVLVGAGASILGRVKVGDGAKIGAAALVLSDIPARATAVGCPAKVVGRTREEDPAGKMDTACHLVDLYRQHEHCLCPFRHLDHANRGYLGPYEFAERLEKQCKLLIPTSDALSLFFEMDKNNDGRLTAKEFDENYHVLERYLQQYGSVATKDAQDDLSSCCDA